MKPDLSCDCCDTVRPCVHLVHSNYAGDTYVCHVCQGLKECDDCQEAEQEAKSGKEA